MKTITVLSGKGGVGKSSITASLGILLAQKHKIILTDCDVDAANLALVFGKKEDDFIAWQDISTSKRAIFDLEKCISCKKCYDSCNFDAIDWVQNKPKLKKMSCEGCGIANLVCPVGAISLIAVNNAKIGHVDTGYGFLLVSSQLKMGASGSGKLVAEVRSETQKVAKEDTEFNLIDAAAGIGCPVIASVTGSDYCILVVEPTEASLFDLRRAFEIVEYFEINCGIVINKFDLDRDYCVEIEKFAKENDIEVVTKFSYDKCFAKALVEMIPVVEKNPNLKNNFEALIKKIEKI